ncbi:GSCOCT00014158001.2-RA-CDS [Cotesia congregata]|uniref:Cc_odve66_5 n=1 Tax=Cotesia congregata TaxID=51543 RepID=A0A8J2MCJ1_COTCN|nr:GSCOCT00014158001.2-RA-CDS [Cotesia congregata]CAG5081114.1 Cc_odve66_5 [Cotesia congregata]
MDAIRSRVPQMGKKAAYVLLFILVILMTLNAIAVYLFAFVFKKDPVSEEIKRICMSNYSYLRPAEHEIINKLLKSSDTAAELDRAFPKWNIESDKFSFVCKFGTKVLQHYAIYGEKKFLDVTIKIIDAMNLQVLKTVNLDSLEWSFERLSEECARFLIAYQYLGDRRYNPSTNEICYDFILKLVPELNKVKTPNNSNFIRGNTARLLSLYMNNYSQYKSDVAGKEMDKFRGAIKNVKKQAVKFDSYPYYNEMFTVFKFWK